MSNKISTDIIIVNREQNSFYSINNNDFDQNNTKNIQF
jgi:hypothetical protein